VTVERTGQRTGHLADVSVVVVNYNGEAVLEACLAAATRTAEGAEIVLVDNGSTDGSLALAKSRFPGVRVEALARNLGFAGGNNAGARAARGRFLAFLNNDTEAQAGWLARLRRALDDHPWAGAATARIVYAHDPSILDSAGDGYTRWGGAFKRGHGQKATSAERETAVFGACGAAFLMRREMFDALGGFDEDFFLSHEDVDLSYRMQLAGAGCIYVPDAVVRHAGSATLGRVSPASVYYGQRNLEWVYLKNTPWPLLLCTLPGHVLYGLAAGAYFVSIGRFGPYLAGKWAALGGMPRMWRKRRGIQARRRVPAGHIAGLMEGGWLALKWREKRFDLGVAGRPSR
jgi:GT2 family glycosyltransferase